jgi:hypothetical protein
MYYVLNYNRCGVLPKVVPYILQRVLQNFKYEDLRIDESENPHQSDEPLIVLSSGIA